ncbi:MAG: exodeoxyribonuclease III [Betaproteobacteria bacterium]|nr:exodeoxyribonuclease III [Betaproteobacteria bacterium]MDH5285253.1 exodeoxyribonuclease III [Betaproteobacteria bacterium]
MKLVTWNVNSLNVRLPRLLAWLAAHRPDVVCLQETKLEDARFPHAELRAAGYASHASGQKTYNGVALLVRDGLAATDVAAGLPGFADEQKRMIAATVAGVRVICAYVPNGQEVGSDKYAYKLAWCAAATAMLRDALSAHAQLAFCGDMNIAPEPRDVHDPAAWEGQVLFSEPERAQFRDWIALGLVDSFRLFDQPPNAFSWWDYRMLAFPKNRGLRIDHVLLSPALARRCTAARIDRNERKGEKPSDHAPVIAELADP